MRTSILSAAILGLFAAGCAGELSGTGTGDDQPPSPNCGNGTIDSGETCDDSNSASGDGCSSQCQTESTGGTPRIAASLDKMTVATALGKTETVTLTLMSIDGFAGSANIAASLVDGANAPIAGVMVTGPTSVSLTADGSAPAQFTVTVPTSATGIDLAATLKLEVTSSAAPVSAASSVNIAAVYTFDYTAGLGTGAANHPGKLMKNVTVKRGAKLRFTNNDTIEHRTHGDGGMAFPHEAAGAGVPGGTYEVNTTVVAPGTTGRLGCHTHPGANDETYANITVQ